MRIFGRELAVVLGFIGAIVTVLVALKFPWLTAGQGAALTAAIFAVLIAVATRPIAPALFTAAFVAIAALFAQYGLHLRDDLIAGVTALILAGFALAGIRPQVTPVVTPVAVTRS